MPSRRQLLAGLAALPLASRVSAQRPLLSVEGVEITIVADGTAGGFGLPVMADGFALQSTPGFPGHCSGEPFIAAALTAMPGRVHRAPVGTRLVFGKV